MPPPHGQPASAVQRFIERRPQLAQLALAANEDADGWVGMSWRSVLMGVWFGHRLSIMGLAKGFRYRKQYGSVLEERRFDGEALYELVGFKPGQPGYHLFAVGIESAAYAVIAEGEWTRKIWNAAGSG